MGMALVVAERRMIKTPNNNNNNKLVYSLNQIAVKLSQKILVDFTNAVDR